MTYVTDKNTTLILALGNLTYFAHTSQIYKDYERLGKEYGDVSSLYLGRR